MRLSEIQITNFRGIVDFKAAIEAKSAVVTGPNGTGKSGIIDAVEYLLVGGISRLEGEGTDEISLDNHARHIDKAIETASIKGKLILSNGNTVVVERGLKDKKIKRIEGDKKDFDTLVEEASSGQFVLSRRELLKFVTCTGSERSQMVQALLNLEEVEKIRKDLGAAFNKIENEKGVLENTRREKLASIDQKLGSQPGKPEERLTKLNQLRATLKAAPITDIFSKDEILKGIQPVSQQSQITLTKKALEDQKKSLNTDSIPAPVLNNAEVTADFKALLEKIANTAEIDRKIKDLEFLEAGILRTGTADLCPLCDLPWENAKLITHLKDKKAAATEAGMGVCLYLALMKKLKGPAFTLALLDDVMMSIDTGHRKQLCSLLKQQFPNTQFVITTHDPAWAKQLRAIDLVPPKNVFFFRSWTPELGPIFDSRDRWTEMRDKANSGDVIGAASLLRNTLENEFQDICENLRGSVVYRGAHNWGLDEFKRGSVGAYRKWIKEAKACAQSWGATEQFKTLEERDKKFTDAMAKSKVEEWEINPTVHHNNWANFSKEEIASTIESMKTLIGEFTCGKCQMYLNIVGASPGDSDAISCICGSTNFTLKKKP